MAIDVLGVKRALPAYVLPDTVPVKAPFHLIVRLADAVVAEPVTQLKGLVENDPVALALVMVTAPSVVVHAESEALTADGFVPPPVCVRGGENDTVADTEQVTEPRAAPENLGAFGALAEAGATSTIKPITTIVAPTTSQRLIESTTS